MADSMQNGNNNMSDIFQSGNLNKATTIKHVYMSTVAQMGNGNMAMVTQSN
jgi:hypothetical protein